MFMKSFVFLHLWVAMATGSDIWTALYSAEECLNSALLQDAIVAPGECVVGKLSDGTTASAKFSCSGTTESSSWSAGVYYGSSCVGFKIMTLAAEDACTCGSSSIFGFAISAYASCAGTAPDCFLNPTQPKVWGAVYAAADCDSQLLVLDTTVPYGDCIGGVLPDGTAISSKFVCHGHTEDSSWETGVYITDDCTGFKVLSLEADDACTCATTSVFGFADLSAYVNCEGTRPDCFEKYPTDDKFDDVSDTPVTLSVYSADSCSPDDVLGSQETVNGQNGCVALTTALGDVGLVVYCDLNEEAEGGGYAYRAEMFASADCSGDPFTSVLGDAASCMDIVSAGSFQVQCGDEESGGGGGGEDEDPSSTAGDEDGGSDSSEVVMLSVLVVVVGIMLLAVCSFLLYRHYGPDRSGRGCCDWSTAKGEGAILDKSSGQSSSYNQL